jgi:hypothetical protein
MAGDTAIQQDAEGKDTTVETTATKGEKQLSPREEQIELIRASRNAQFEAEAGVKVEPRSAAEPPAGDPPADTAPPADDPPKDDLSSAVQLGRQLEDGTIELTPEDLKRVRVRSKVDGEEIVVEGTKALGQYQKGAAAEVRLERATAAQREAERLLAEAKQRAAEATTAAEKREAKKDEAAAQQELDAAKKEFVDALYGGDTQKAAELFDRTVNAAVDRALAGRAPSATLSPDEIAQKAAELAVPRIRQVTSREDALKASRADYPEIFEDRDFALIADRHINALIDEGKDMADAIIDGVAAAAQKLGIKKAAERQAPAATTTRSERLAAKKEGLDEPTTTAARAAIATPQPKTASDRIAEIAKARGQG